MLLSRVARPLLAAVSVANGVDTLMNPKPRIEAVTPLLAKGQGVLPAAVSPALVVQAGAAAKIAAGVLMGLGWAPRLAATVLAVDLIPNTVAEQPFGSAGSPDARKARQERFLSNCGLLGGLLLAVATPRGKRSKRGRKLARKLAAKRRARMAR
ncbi:MAG: DoxX family membrane protein [Actinomycetota bacterium]|nr:DoxX family membrane protein [Actinomycetota bacterium]